MPLKQFAREQFAQAKHSVGLVVKDVVKVRLWKTMDASPEFKAGIRKRYPPSTGLMPYTVEPRFSEPTWLYEKGMKPKKILKERVLSADDHVNRLRDMSIDLKPDQLIKASHQLDETANNWAEWLGGVVYLHDEIQKRKEEGEQESDRLALEGVFRDAPGIPPWNPLFGKLNQGSHSD